MRLHLRAQTDDGFLGRSRRRRRVVKTYRASRAATYRYTLLRSGVVAVIMLLRVLG